MRMKKGCSIFTHAGGGVTLEYAVLLPILFMMIMGIVEYDLIMYSLSTLNGALATAARAGTTGYVNTAATGNCPSPVNNGIVTPQSQASYINCIVKNSVRGLLKTDKLQISYNDTGSGTYNSATNTPTFTGPCTNNPAQANPPTYPLCPENTQNAGDIVVYTIRYDWPVFTPILGPILGNTFILKSSIIVKNEPYNVGAR